MSKERKLLGKSRGPKIMSDAEWYMRTGLCNREMPVYLLLVVNEFLDEGVWGESELSSDDVHREMSSCKIYPAKNNLRFFNGC